MDVVDFASRVYKLLRSREEYIKEVLAADGLPSWEESYGASPTRRLK